MLSCHVLGNWTEPVPVRNQFYKAWKLQPDCLLPSMFYTFSWISFQFNHFSPCCDPVVCWSGNSSSHLNWPYHNSLSAAAALPAWGKPSPSTARLSYRLLPNKPPFHGLSTAVHDPSAKCYQLSCLHGRCWRKRRKIGIWVGEHQILPVLEVWRR